MIIDVFIPAIVVLLMLLVGTGLQLAQLKAMLRSPRLVIAGMLAQIFLLPVGALLIIFLVHPEPELAAGLLLVAACPGGALSNTYCYLGGLNVALSVMLTAVSTMLSFVALPLILGITFPAIASGWEMEIPVRELALRLLLFLLFPIGAGMLIRARFHPWLKSRAGRLRITSLGLLVALLVLIVVDQWETVRASYVESAVLAVLFTGFAVLVARGVGGILGMERDERYVFAIEFAIRNIGAAALVAASTLGHPEFLAFGALFVVFQFPLIAVLLYRYRSGPGATVR